MQTPIYDWTSNLSVEPSKCLNTSQVYWLKKKTVAGGHNNHTPIPRLLANKTIGILIGKFYLVKSYTLEIE